MKRKNFLLGAAALAAGCGGGGSNTSLSYRKVALGQGSVLGLDDTGRVYLKRADGSSVRWQNGSFETLPIDSPQKEIQKVRPDGILLTKGGFFTPDNIYHPITLPTVTELGVSTEGRDSFYTRFVDASTPNDFMGEVSFHLTGYGGPTGGIQTMVFVVRDGVPSLLPENYSRAVQFLSNGHFVATDKFFVLFDSGADRIFGPNNTLVDHVANSLNIRLLSLSTDLNFAGRIINTQQIATGAPVGYSLEEEPAQPRSHIEFVTHNSRGDLILNRVSLKEGATQTDEELYLKLSNGTSTRLKEFLPELSNSRVGVAVFNARREFVLQDFTNRSYEEMGDLFLMTPIS
ncbi:MAG: hypothetical protein QM758_09450 [Armatimonas sp.]